MTKFLRIRNNIHFRRYFDAVHPFFWPIIYWQLGQFFKWMHAEKLNAVFFEITWWGGVHVLYEGDRIEALEHNPFAPTRPRWDDPVWASDVPACLGDLASDAALRLVLILPRFSGGGGWTRSGQSEGALAPIPNTS